VQVIVQVKGVPILAIIMVGETMATRSHQLFYRLCHPLLDCSLNLHANGILHYALYLQKWSTLGSDEQVVHIGHLQADKGAKSKLELKKSFRPNAKFALHYVY